MGRTHARAPAQVFVGNIPYGTTEEQMLSMFSEVGRVLNVRGFRDTETGKPKGYAFIEYESAASAMSAIRNLNNRASPRARPPSKCVEYSPRASNWPTPNRAGDRREAAPGQLLEGFGARRLRAANG